jgi:hypothetical protein
VSLTRAKESQLQTSTKKTLYENYTNDKKEQEITFKKKKERSQI